MLDCDTLLRNSSVFDGSVGAPEPSDAGSRLIEAGGLAFARSFIEVRTHHDIDLIRHPAMLAKLSRV
jgi:N-acyl-D-aspartate/D-glutamate deacylase